MSHHVDLSLFNSKIGLERGRSISIEIIWYIVKRIFFLSSIPWPNSIKVFLLRVFGARVGRGSVIKPRINIHFPWKLELGDYVWLGEEVFILNFEPIRVGSHVCISQRSFLGGGNHDYRDLSFKYRNGPINIKDGAWIGAQTFIGPNVTISRYSVVTAGSIVTRDLPEGMVCSGNPCAPERKRWNDE